MRVIQTTGFYFPNSTGGTEVYVDALAKHLREHGIKCIVAAPSQTSSHYFHQGIEVFRYPVPEKMARIEIQGRRPPPRFNEFERWLIDQGADVYHQHSWTTGCGLSHLDAAKRHGLKTVLTVHVATNICLRGTMLFEGSGICDGVIEAQRCASCWLQSKGVPRTVAKYVAKLPEGSGAISLVPRIGPMLAAKALAARRKADIKKMACLADRVIVPCHWVYDALVNNGLPQQKLILNRQGIDYKPVTIRTKRTCTTLRFGFLGRWDPVKGIHIIVEAFKRLPNDRPVELVVCATGLQHCPIDYSDKVRHSAGLDRRIRSLSPIDHEQVGSYLAEIDVLLVPSQCLETGPIVVLEAFSVGTPVVGSDIGGIKELITNEQNGLLVTHDSVGSWTDAMSRLVDDRGLLERLRNGVGSVRTMSKVANDMAAIYRELCR
jgi:glycosyltransferase involved in cell wall biosynthesis